MLKWIRGFVAAVLGFFFTIIMATVSLLASLVEKTGRTQYACERIWSRFILAVSGVRVNLKGTEHIDPRNTYIFAANHQSYFDIWSLLACFPARFRFIAKESLFRWPFLGWHLRRAGHVAIDRDDIRRSIRVLQNRAAESVKGGHSILIFPEGTRSINGEIGEFRKGSMLLAEKTGVPIVPVAISGSRRCLPKGSIIPKPGIIDIAICKPIHTKQYTIRNLSTLADLVRHEIVDHYVKR